MVIAGRWLPIAVGAGGEAMGGGDLHLRVLRVIAIVDWLKDRSGLAASLDLLKVLLVRLRQKEARYSIGRSTGLVTDRLPEVYPCLRDLRGKRF